MKELELIEILKENPDFITSLQNRIEEQEKEIEKLKDKLGIQDYSNNSLLKAVSKIKKQAKEIEELKQIVESTIKQAFYEDDYHKLKAEYDLLKAHPMRELSNEKIAEIADKVFYHWYSMDDMIDYARAIIKASRGEK